jgi:spermidine synthase
MLDSYVAGLKERSTTRSSPQPVPPRTAELRPAARLVAISALALFLEMALIRFINATVQVIAYFNNFVILATFLGLGFGALWARRSPRLFAHAPVLLASFVGVLVVLDRYAASLEDTPELVTWTQTNQDLPLELPSGVVVTLVFCACFAVFVPLGCELGQRLEAFEDRLAAYGYDLLGSITGVLTFAIVSWGRFPPWAWFAIASIALGVLLWAAGYKLRIRSVFLTAIVAFAALVSDGYYSPYYKIHLAQYFEAGGDKPTHYSVFVDKLRIQDAIDFDQDLEKTAIAAWVPYYMLPYKLRPAPSRVLVLGGGSGNDTAIALKAGAKHVTTVEVDPVLVDFGHVLHPQRPYADPRVEAVNDDARAYLRRNDEKFDLIVMNALDSHKQLPGLSTLRLESYIYTVQAFEDVRRHMNPDSVFVVHLSSSRHWMGERLYWSLAKAFGREPTLLATAGSPFESIAFVFAPEATLRAARERNNGLLWGPPKHFREVRASTTLATDDWPHLYLASRQIPSLYYKVLAFVIILTLLCLRALGTRRADAGLMHFMLLGASFMLLETRAITQFALLFGSTWLVNAIVVSSILVVIYLGNLLLQKRTMPPKPVVYAALLASLIALYFIPLDAALPFSLPLRVLIAGLVIGAPVFGASLIFSDSFRRAPDASSAFGANLVGVVIGGALEYSSMQFGLKFLYLIAAAMYVAAWAAERYSARSSPKLAT